MTTKPQKLRSGDTIALVAPAGPVADKKCLDAAVAEIEKRGFNVVQGRYIAQPPYGYLSGTDDQRRADLEEMLQRADVKAIFCLKGGYGSIRLLGGHSAAILPTGKKIFVGFSDITTLLLAGYAANSGAVFHGPMPVFNFTSPNGNNANANKLFDLITGDAAAQAINLAEDQYSSLSNSAISGTLWGGNLSGIANLLGTSYISGVSDSIIFFEEVDERPYAIDRYLTHIEYTGLFKGARAFIVGELVDCEPMPGKPSFTAKEVIEERLSRYGVPVVFTNSFGHGVRMCTFPIGCRATLNCANGILHLDESPVSQS